MPVKSKVSYFCVYFIDQYLYLPWVHLCEHLHLVYLVYLICFVNFLLKRYFMIADFGLGVGLN